MGNLAPTIRIADRVYVYDNSIEEAEARLCFRTQDGPLRKVYADLPPWASTAATDLAPIPAFTDARKVG